MKQITYEEAMKSFKLVDRSIGEHGWFNSEEIKPIENFIEQHKPPIFEEVVKAWEEAIGDKLDFITNDEGIRVILPNKTYYLINKEQVYSNRAVFSMNVNATLYAINLTIRYLQAKE